MPKLIKGSTSQASQESFVLNVLKEKHNGTYVELGGGWAERNSNTYLLETRYGWKGLSFENDPSRAHDYNLTRKNKTLQTDARWFNYERYFIENNYPIHIDYLQMDLHPAFSTFEALKNMPLRKYRFSTITFEHNGYQDRWHKEFIQGESQRMLKDLGYVLVTENVIFNGKAYEDWYVDPRVVPYDNYKDFINKDILHSDLFDG
jgi:hypothetical protein